MIPENNIREETVKLCQEKGEHDGEERDEKG